MTIIKASITEKSMARAQRGLYTFEVSRDSTKPQIKQAVQSAFKVQVTRVNIAMRHVRGKRRGAKRLVTTASSAKYAIVSLKAGQSLDIFDQKETK